MYEPVTPSRIKDHAGCPIISRLNEVTYTSPEALVFNRPSQNIMSYVVGNVSGGEAQ
ncbi:hypothetical protein GCK32_016161, partial [Trichostrongylus colubriformis]